MVKNFIFYAVVLLILNIYKIFGITKIRSIPHSYLMDSYHGTSINIAIELTNGKVDVSSGGENLVKASILVHFFMKLKLGLSNAMVTRKKMWFIS